MDDIIACVRWLPLPNVEHNASPMNDKTDISPTGDYLPSLPVLHRTFNQEPERKEFLSHTLDMLLVSITNKQFIEAI